MDNAPDEWVVLRMNRVGCCCSSQVVKIQAGLLLSLEVAVAGLADDQERGPVICLRGEFFRNLALAENWKCCGLTPLADSSAPAIPSRLQNLAWDQQVGWWPLEAVAAAYRPRRVTELPSCGRLKSAPGMTMHASTAHRQKSPRDMGQKKGGR